MPHRSHASLLSRQPRPDDYAGLDVLELAGIADELIATAANHRGFHSTLLFHLVAISGEQMRAYDRLRGYDPNPLADFWSEAGMLMTKHGVAGTLMLDTSPKEGPYAKTRPFDPAVALNTEDACREYLSANAEAGGLASMEAAREVVRRARIMHGLPE